MALYIFFKVSLEILVLLNNLNLSHFLFKAMKNVDYEGPQTKFNLVVKELPQFRSLSHIYSKSDSHDEQMKKAKNYLTGTIHMGCSSLNDIHNAYLDVKFSSNQIELKLIKYY